MYEFEVFSEVKLQRPCHCQEQHHHFVLSDQNICNAVKMMFHVEFVLCCYSTCLEICQTMFP